MHITGPTWIAVAGITGALGVTMGAFGAHVLPGVMETWQLPPDEIISRMNTFEIGVRYHMYHALALWGVGLLAVAHESKWIQMAGIAFLAGVLVFSGLLYVLVFTGIKTLGAVVPLGGVAFILGWVALAGAGMSFLRSR